MANRGDPIYFFLWLVSIIIAFLHWLFHKLREKLSDGEADDLQAALEIEYTLQGKLKEQRLDEPTPAQEQRPEKQQARPQDDDPFAVDPDMFKPLDICKNEDSAELKNDNDQDKLFR